MKTNQLIVIRAHLKVMNTLLKQDKRGKPTEKPTQKPTEKGSEKPTDKATQKPTSTQSEKPTAGHTEKPTGTQSEKPTAGHTEKPTAGQSGKPTTAKGTTKPTSKSCKDKPTKPSTIDCDKDHTVTVKDDNTISGVIKVGSCHATRFQRKPTRCGGVGNTFGSLVTNGLNKNGIKGAFNVNIVKTVGDAKQTEFHYECPCAKANQQAAIAQLKEACKSKDLVNSCTSENEPTDSDSCSSESDEHTTKAGQTGKPTEKPTQKPTEKGSEKPTDKATQKPTGTQSEKPTGTTSEKPTAGHTDKPTGEHTAKPTGTQSEKPTAGHTEKPTGEHTGKPTGSQSEKPTAGHTEKPTGTQSEKPTAGHTEKPTGAQSEKPTAEHTGKPTGSQSEKPTAGHTDKPTGTQSGKPTAGHTEKSTTVKATIKPTGKSCKPHQPSKPSTIDCDKDHTVTVKDDNTISGVIKVGSCQASRFQRKPSRCNNVGDKFGSLLTNGLNKNGVSGSYKVNIVKTAGDSQQTEFHYECPCEKAHQQAAIAQLKEACKNKDFSNTCTNENVPTDSDSCSSESDEQTTKHGETPKSTAGHTDKPTGTQSGKSTAGLTEKSTGTHSEKPTAGHTDKPTGTQSEKPTAGHTEKPTGTHSEKPTGTQSEKPTAGHTDKPTGTQSEKPTGTHSEKPTAGHTDKPTGEHSEKPTGEHTGKPTGTQSEKPTAGHTDKPTGTQSAKPTAGHTEKSTTAKATIKPTGKSCKPHQPSKPSTIDCDKDHTVTVKDDNTISGVIKVGSCQASRFQRKPSRCNNVGDKFGSLLTNGLNKNGVAGSYKVNILKTAGDSQQTEFHYECPCEKAHQQAAIAQLKEACKNKDFSNTCTNENVPTDSDSCSSESNEQTTKHGETPKSTAGHTDKPTGTQSAKPTGSKSEKPTAGHTDKPTGTQSEKPTGIQSEKPTAGHTEKPTGTQSGKPTAGHTEKSTTAKATIKPTGKSCKPHQPSKPSTIDCDKDHTVTVKDDNTISGVIKVGSCQASRFQRKPSRCNNVGDKFGSLLTNGLNKNGVVGSYKVNIVKTAGNSQQTEFHYECPCEKAHQQAAIAQLKEACKNKDFSNTCTNENEPTDSDSCSSESNEQTTKHGETPKSTAGHTDKPTGTQSGKPTAGHTDKPTGAHSEKPTGTQSEKPTAGHTEKPTGTQSEKPTGAHSEKPTAGHTDKPTGEHSEKPTGTQSEKPTAGHTDKPTGEHSEKPTGTHSEKPTGEHTDKPTGAHTDKPTGTHSEKPTAGHTDKPTGEHSEKPTGTHSEKPTAGHTEKSTTAKATTQRNPLVNHANLINQANHATIDCDKDHTGTQSKMITLYLVLSRYGSCQASRTLRRKPSRCTQCWKTKCWITPINQQVNTQQKWSCRFIQSQHCKPTAGNSQTNGISL